MPATPNISRYFRRLAGALPHLPSTLRLVWQAAPILTFAWTALLLLQGFLPVATVYLTRPVVNGIVAAIRANGDWRPILWPASLMAAVLLLTELLRTAVQWIRTAQADLVQDHIASLIHQKSLEADLAFYESPDFYDHLHRARSEAGHRPVALLETLGGLLQNSVTLAAMLVVLAVRYRCMASSGAVRRHASWPWPWCSATMPRASTSSACVPRHLSAAPGITIG